MQRISGLGQALRLAILTVFASLTVAAIVPATSAYAMTLDSEEVSLCQQVNSYRAQHGLAPLLVSTALTNDAEWMSTDMAQKNYFSHTDSLGRDSFQRMAAFGYGYATAKAENIAAGSATASATMSQWEASAPHNANLLSSSYKVMGLGRAYAATSQYQWYWTNTFGGYNDGGIPCPSVLPTLAVNDATVTEGNSGTKSAVFSVTRSGPTTGISSVYISTADGTATAGSDYAARPLTGIRFYAGETTKAVIVTVYGDVTPEPSESFALRLSSPTDATISDATGVGRIMNDDM